VRHFYRGLIQAIWLLSTAILAYFPVVSYATDAMIPGSSLDAIYNNSPASFGNYNGVTIVEFFDYRCSYCKAMEPELEKLLQEDGDLRIIYMDFPKLGPLSVTAATIALASLRQGTDKYLTFHNRLMGSSVNNEAMIYQAAADSGLNVTRLKQDAADPTIAAQIQNNMNLGRQVGVSITPSFIIAGRFYPGFAHYAQLKERINYARTRNEK
jgi:protein-disulfide isomerase